MAAGSIQPFRASGTATLAATTASGSVALAGAGDTCMVFNNSTGTAFVRFGADLTVPAAVATDIPVPSGVAYLLGIGTVVQAAAAILDAGAGNVFFTRGDGSIF